jgi:hypothetical protein
MDEFLKNPFFKKEADTYFRNSEKYSSKIIDLLFKNDYSKKELSVHFNSKPRFYVEFNRLKKSNILIMYSENVSLSSDFKRALNYYSLYYKTLKKTKVSFDNLKNESFSSKVANLANDLEKLLK